MVLVLDTLTEHWQEEMISLMTFGRILVLVKYFVGFDDNVKTTEESDKYVVSYDQENLSPDEVNVDFDKQENELIITVTQETEKMVLRKVALSTVT